MLFFLSLCGEKNYRSEGKTLKKQDSNWSLSFMGSVELSVYRGTLLLKLLTLNIVTQMRLVDHDLVCS